MAGLSAITTEQHVSEQTALIIHEIIQESGGHQRRELTRGKPPNRELKLKHVMLAMVLVISGRKVSKQKNNNKMCWKKRAYR